MLRALLLVTAGIIVLAFTPLAAAQATMKIETVWAHPEVLLPELGREDVALTVNAKVSGTNCAAEQTFTIDLTLDTFEKWAGASFIPKQVSFKVPAGPVMAEQRLEEQEAVLNIAWDVEEAPRYEAAQQYRVVIVGDEVAKSGGPCLPDVVVEDHTSEPLRIYMEDRPEIKQELPCSEDPYQPKCTTQSAEPVPPAPAAGPLVLLLILALATLVRRRVR